MGSDLPKPRHPIHSFDIDQYLNPLIPRPRFHVLPTPISYWFGYRPPPKNPSQPNKPPASSLLVWLFAFLGGFIGIAIIENVFRHLPLLDGHPVPLVVASFGAAAILEYNTIESPLSQPRNLILGHLISAVIGVAITKGFLCLPPEQFEEYRWIAGALAVGTSSAVMSITKTIHPPAGATALLAATTDSITMMGWWLCALVLLGSSLMLTSAMLINNLYKRFPLYWWTPADLSKSRHEPDIVKASESKDVEYASTSSTADADSLKDGRASHVSRVDSNATTEDGKLDTAEKKQQRRIESAQEGRELEITIERDRIVVPDWLVLSQWEAEVLEGFQTRLQERTGGRS